MPLCLRDARKVAKLQTKCLQTNLFLLLLSTNEPWRQALRADTNNYFQLQRIIFTTAARSDADATEKSRRWRRAVRPLAHAGAIKMAVDDLWSSKLSQSAAGKQLGMAQALERQTSQSLKNVFAGPPFRLGSLYVCLASSDSCLRWLRLRPELCKSHHPPSRWTSSNKTSRASLPRPSLQAPLHCLRVH